MSDKNILLCFVEELAIALATIEELERKVEDLANDRAAADAEAAKLRQEAEGLRGDVRAAEAEAERARDAHRAARYRIVQAERALRGEA